MKETILTANDLKFRYDPEKPVYALNGVSVGVRRGEFVAVLGANGCGKSTLAKHFNAILLPESGTVMVEGMDTKDEDKIYDIRQKVGMVFQSPDNQIVATVVEEDVAFALENLGVPPEEMRRRVDDAMKMAGIYEYRERAPHNLSGGQKQRVAIARALINNPRVLLLDEPLGALDLKLRKQMQIELKRLQKKLGITFVYVTHDQEEAMTMSDRIAVMRDGVILQMDAPAKIYDRPNCRFVADFIGESNVISGVVRSVEGEKLSVETPDGMILACGEGFTVGEKICVSVRSEYLNLSATPVEGFTLRGKVKDFIYIGTVIKTAVELKDGQEIKQSRFEQDGTLREGADVYAWWEPHHGVAIHDASEAEVQS